MSPEERICRSWRLTEKGFLLGPILGMMVSLSEGRKSPVPAPTPTPSTSMREPKDPARSPRSLQLLTMQEEVWGWWEQTGRPQTTSQNFPVQRLESSPSSHCDVKGALESGNMTRHRDGDEEGTAESCLDRRPKVGWG